MKKRLDSILNIVMGSFIGVFIGHSLFRYFDYKNNPGIYEIQSAPWYTSIQINGAVVALVVIIAITIKFLMRRMGKL